MPSGHPMHGGAAMSPHSDSYQQSPLGPNPARAPNSSQYQTSRNSHHFPTSRSKRRSPIGIRYCYSSQFVVACTCTYSYVINCICIKILSQYHNESQCCSKSSQQDKVQVISIDGTVTKSYCIHTISTDLDRIEKLDSH